MRVEVEPAPCFTDPRVARYAPASMIAAHCHAAASLTVILTGGYAETIRGRTDMHRAGALLFYPAGTPHAQQFGPRGAHKLLLSPGAQMLDYLSSTLLLAEAPSTRSTEIARLGHRAAAEIAAADAFSPAILEGIGWELAALFGRGVEHAGRLPSASVATACDYMTDNPDRPASIGRLASVAKCHPSTLTRAFRRELGCTPGEHQRRLRVAQATDMLRATRMPLGEIALATGFCDQSHLTRVFKAVHGCTPGQYRRRA